MMADERNSDEVLVAEGSRWTWLGKTSFQAEERKKLEARKKVQG